MANPKTLRVLCRGSAMVPDYEAMGAGARRFVGRQHDPSLGDEHVDPDTKQKARQGGFRALVGEIVEVPDRAEYRLALRGHLNGGPPDLWPADAETAQAAGVKFDPSFGGEHPALAKPAPAPAAPPPLTATKGV